MADRVGGDKGTALSGFKVRLARAWRPPGSTEPATRSVRPTEKWVRKVDGVQHRLGDRVPGVVDVSITLTVVTVDVGSVYILLACLLNVQYWSTLRNGGQAGAHAAWAATRALPTACQGWAWTEPKVLAPRPHLTHVWTA